MNKLDRDYQLLLQDILDNGHVKSDRTGTGTKSVFGRQIRYNMLVDGKFPILTTKKVSFKNIVVELLWFLKGDTNIKYLVDNNCHIWDGDCYKSYITKTNHLEKRCFGDYIELELFGALTGGISDSKFRQYTKEEFINKIKTDDVFSKKWGELGPVYGKQWRKFTNYEYELDSMISSGYFNNPIDQISNLIEQIKTNPDSRRLKITAWNPAEVEEATLPPCHTSFQIYTRELTNKERNDYFDKTFGIYGKLGSRNIWEDYELDQQNVPSRAISLLYRMRSNDFFLGSPYNTASYNLLLNIIAQEVNMVPEEIIGQLGDTHLYLNHIEQAKEQITRTSFELPTLEFSDEFYKIIKNSNKTFSEKIDLFTPDMFKLKNYVSHDAIKAPLSN